MTKFQYLLLVVLITPFISCKKDKTDPIVEPDPTPAQVQLIIGAEFSSTLPRLGNLGLAVGVPTGNAAQSPVINSISMHYIEFAKDSLTALGAGDIVYQGIETSIGGGKAVDFDQAVLKGNNETFVSMNLSDLAPGTYNWLRVSLTYQNYDIQYRFNDSVNNIVNQDLTGTLASFVGFNNYITKHTIKDSAINVNANKLQGFWAFETSIDIAGNTYSSTSQGDGAGVTVVNPLSATSPVPAGSCVVTGKLSTPLVITGNETANVEVILAFSINDSFEWTEVVVDGKFEPGAGEKVADMGLRGLHPYVK